jgi:hypothetical protein
MNENRETSTERRYLSVKSLQFNKANSTQECRILSAPKVGRASKRV